MKTPEPPPDLTDAILRATLGPVCASAHDRLCDWVDGALGATDDRLVAMHLGACAECSALAAMLRRLSTDLPALAEMDPGPGFTAAVLAATSWRRPLPLGARLAEAWQALLRRPRFAWEGAYIGAFVLLLLFGTPSSPFAGMPQQALALASINPIEEIREPVSDLRESVAGKVSETWSSASSGVASTSMNVAGSLRGSFTGLVDAFTPLLGSGPDDHVAAGDARTEPGADAGRPSDRRHTDSSQADDANDRSRDDRDRQEGEIR